MDGEPRFMMLETIREYALERLAASGEEDAMRQRHAAFFRLLADRAAGLRGPDQLAWLDRLEAEHDNIHTALIWAIEREPTVAEQLGASLYSYWWSRGYWSEGYTWMERVISESSAVRATARSVCPSQRGRDGRIQQRHAQARALLEESLALFRERNDQSGTIDALFELASSAYNESDHKRHFALCAESLRLCRVYGDKSRLLNALGSVAYSTYIQGDLAAARALAEEQLALASEVGMSSGRANALFMLGTVAAMQGDSDQAERLLGESLTIWQRLGDRFAISVALNHLGQAAYARRDYTLALERYTASLALRRELDNRRGCVAMLFNVADANNGLGDKQQARAFCTEGLRISSELAYHEGSPLGTVFHGVDCHSR